MNSYNSHSATSIQTDAEGKERWATGQGIENVWLHFAAISGTF
jgi:hypothetical protein